MTPTKEIKYHELEHDEQTGTLEHSFGFAVVGRTVKVGEEPCGRWCVIAAFTNAFTAKLFALHFEATMNKDLECDLRYHYKAVQLSEPIK